VIFPVPSDCKRSILHLNSLLEKGQYQAVIDRTYSPDQIQEAYEYVASGQKTGSVLLRF
jgi:NADPH:quinone reductase-like Zn-dependent oxidoreductase